MIFIWILWGKNSRGCRDLERRTITKEANTPQDLPVFPGCQACNPMECQRGGGFSTHHCTNVLICVFLGRSERLLNANQNVKSEAKQRTLFANQLTLSTQAEHTNAVASIRIISSPSIRGVTGRLLSRSGRIPFTYSPYAYLTSIRG